MKTNTYIEEAGNLLLQASASNEEKEIYEARMKALIDTNSYISAAKEEGYDEGYTNGYDSGFDTGFDNGKFKTIAELFRDKDISLETAAKKLIITEDEFLKKYNEHFQVQ